MITFSKSILLGQTFKRIIVRTLRIAQNRKNIHKFEKVARLFLEKNILSMKIQKNFILEIKCFSEKINK